jgi:thymidine kinase
MKSIRTTIGEPAASRLPFVFVDEGQFLLPGHVEQMRALADADIANFEIYGLLTDFRAQYFPGSDALVRNADHISMANREIEHLCEESDCTRIALRNTRLIQEVIVRDGPQIAIDGIDATYKALCSKHYYAR